ncbi:hypothetical protein ESB00_08220 [Oleiharenicola lentus]|uniref:FecR protein domain-containing protein n=1 Tax=Oleiharenicola lentus TaxID=2508720 RepID=A0A4Q1C9Z4_9BACT|nr:hypothetical protein [Oleiharenicola lentus]RXK55855.1 hypothetical protein ESB00_08220 [Oleiharenicola lentus]
MKRCPPPTRWLALLVLPLLFTWAQATTVIAPSFDRLVDGSDYIVRGTVKSIASEWRDNPAKPGSRYIGSRVELDVSEVIKGSPPAPLVLEVVGGKVGDEELTVDGAPRFVVGQETVLFVKGNGRLIVPLVGMMHGKYDVRKNKKTGRAEILRSDGQPLFHEQEVVLPTASAKASALNQTKALPLSPDEFATRIRKNLSSRNRETLE